MILIYPLGTHAGSIIHVPPEDAIKFQEMVHRATNLWPDAPPEIKHFADNVTNGRPMQDYFGNPHLAGKVLANQSDQSYKPRQY